MSRFSLAILCACISCFNLVFASSIEDKNIVEALKTANSKEWKNAYEIAQTSSNPKLAHSLIQFKEIMSTQEPLTAAIAFSKQNTWFPICIFHNEIEQKITSDTDHKTIISWFKVCPPKTQSAQLIYSYAQTILKKIPANHNFFKLWAQVSVNHSLDKDILNRFHNTIPKSLISLKAFKQIWKGNYHYINYYNQFLDKNEQTLHRLRITYAQNLSSYERLVAKYPFLKNDEYIQFKHITQLLKERKDSEAYSNFLMIKKFTDANKWWKPRHTIVRNFIREKKYYKAYQLASTHKNKTGDAYQEAEWISGWISLRFLNKPKNAAYHFYRSYLDCKYAACKSRAAYWLARSYHSLNEKPKAKSWYRTASKHKMHFYGILSMSEIDIAYENNKVYLNTKKHSKLELERFENIKKATYYMWRSDNGRTAFTLSRYIAESSLSHEIKSNVIDYFNTQNTLPLMVQYTKFLSNHKGPFLTKGYPTSIKIDNHKNSKALYLAIIRQESNFDHKAVSPAGAVGLMQLIPSTAKKYAKTLNLHHNAFKKDPKANVAKGVLYIDYLVEYFGHIIPAIASYNAGENAVTRWISEFGDPAKMTDNYQLLDWIECIPYQETRNYVKKVLENKAIYEKILNPNSSYISFMSR